jgi:hypothetical protein
MPCDITTHATISPSVNTGAVDTRISFSSPAGFTRISVSSRMTSPQAATGSSAVTGRPSGGAPQPFRRLHHPRLVGPDPQGRRRRIGPQHGAPGIPDRNRVGDGVQDCSQLVGLLLRLHRNGCDPSSAFKRLVQQSLALFLRPLQLRDVPQEPL